MQFHAKSQFARELKKIIEETDDTVDITISVTSTGYIKVRQDYVYVTNYYLCPIYGAGHGPSGLGICTHSSHH